MEKRHKIEIGIAVLVIVALILLILWLLRAPIEQAVIEDQPIEDVADVGLSDIVQDKVQQLDDADTISRIFVERLGSFSNQSDYENLDVVKEISTQSLRNQLDDIAQDAKNENNGAYYGVSTSIISLKEISITDTQASYEIKTQRQESIGSPSNTTARYQDIVVYLKKVDGEWLVDDFDWE